MKVKFRTNLGTRDAEALGLKACECQDGCECDVKESVAAILCERGIAEAIEEKRCRPQKVEAVPAEPAIAEKKAEPTIEAKEPAKPTTAKTTSKPQSKGK